MTTLRTGELARRAGVNVETLRFYERKGLLPKPPRRGAYRAYPPEMLDRLRFIKRAQELGFSLAEIADLLDLGVDDDTTCADVKHRAEAKINEVQRKITDLRAMQKALRRLAQACPGKGSTDHCPILGLVRLNPDRP